LEKSRRLRRARCSLDIRYSSGPVVRGKKEERPCGSCGAPGAGCCREKSAPPRSERASRYRYGRTKNVGAAPFFLARKAVTGLRFRFTWPVSEGNIDPSRETNTGSPAGLKTGAVGPAGRRCGRGRTGKLRGKHETPAETIRPASVTTELCTVL